MSKENFSSLKAEYLAAYLRSYRKYYPEIDVWQKSVLQELGTCHRSAFALVRRGRIRGLAITKNGRFGKLCHISIDETDRHLGFGPLLMRSAIKELITQGACHVHVTTGPEATKDHGWFFEKAGFSVLEYQKSRYVEDREEICWGANIRELSRGVFERSSSVPLTANSVSIVRLGSGEVVF